MTCEYCRQPIRGNNCLLEIRPYKTIRLDGTVAPRESSFPVCNPCDRRLPVNR